jgi:hypothetical protein
MDALRDSVEDTQEKMLDRNRGRREADVQPT